jgi:hypothetical protein
MVPSIRRSGICIQRKVLTRPQYTGCLESPESVYTPWRKAENSALAGNEPPITVVSRAQPSLYTHRAALHVSVIRTRRLKIN